MKLSDVVIYLKFCGIQLIFVFSQYVEEPKGWYFCKSCAWNDNHTIQGTAWENISWPKFSRISSLFSVLLILANCLDNSLIWQCTYSPICSIFSILNTKFWVPVLLCTFFLCLVRDHLFKYSSLHSVHLYTIFIVPPELELSGTLGSSWEPLLIFFKCFLRLLLVENIHSQWLHLYSSFWLWTLCLWLERSVFVSLF